MKSSAHIKFRSAGTNGKSASSIDGRRAFSYALLIMIMALLLACLLAAAPLDAQAGAQAADASLAEILHAVSGFTARQEGSPGEKALVAWIEQRLSSHDIGSTRFDFSQTDIEHSFSTCLRVDLPGASRDTMIIAVPLDAPPFDAARDGSVAVALAVDLLESMHGTTPSTGLTVLFLGAEYGDTDVYPMGSNLFLRDFQPDSRAALVYLNLHAVPTRVLVRGGGRRVVSPYWLLNRSMDALREARVPFRLPGDETQIFRIGATEEKTLIEPWLLAGYPSVGIEGEYGGGASVPEDQGLARLASFLRALVRAGSAGIPEEWDRHYLQIQAGDFSLIIAEREYIVLLCATFAAGLLYALVFRTGLKKYTKTLTRHILALVPLVGLSFGFLVAGTYAVEGILALRGFPELWKLAPLEFLALKACAALFLYAILYNRLRRIRLTLDGSFYTAAALFLLLVDIIVVAIFDISFTFYFLWAFIFVFLSTLMPNRWAKTLLVIPAPFWGLKGVILVFLAPALPFCRFFLLSPLWGNLLIAGACLPIVLVFLRVGLLFRGRGLLRRGRRELILAGLLLAAGGALAVRLATFSPFSAAHPQQLSATQTVVVDAEGRTTSTYLSLASEAPLGSLSVRDAGGTIAVPAAAAQASLPLAIVASPLRVSVESGQFLQQRTVTLRVAMPSPPRLFTVALTSRSDFILYDSSFPAVRVSPREYRLLVGAFPPDPLILQLSLPVDGEFTISLSAEFDAPLIGVEVGTRPDLRVATRVRILHRIDVKT